MEIDISNLNPDDENLDIILNGLSRAHSNQFYIQPDSELCPRGLEVYKKALMSLPTRHRIKFAVRNLCTQLARTTVTLEEMQDQIARDGLTSIGSQGQVVKNPLLSVASQYLSQVEKLTSKLAIGITEDRRTSATAAKNEREEVVSAKIASKTGLLAVPN